MSSDDGTGVGETVVLMENVSTGPTKRFQRSFEDDKATKHIQEKTYLQCSDPLSW
jgi:hypothetical protein